MRDDWLSDDEHLMSMLSHAMLQQDAVPPEVLQAGYAAFTWRDVDSELAALAYDSTVADPSLAGARSQHADVRAITFTSSTLTVELEVSSGSLLGQLVPAEADHVLLMVQGKPGFTVPVDETGCFTIEPVPTGTFRLQVPDMNVKTDWIALR